MEYDPDDPRSRPCPTFSRPRLTADERAALAAEEMAHLRELAQDEADPQAAARRGEARFCFHNAAGERGYYE